RLVLVVLVLLLVGVFMLARGRGKSVSRLADDLEGDNAKGRRHAAKELAGLGSKARGAVPSLTEALKDPDRGCATTPPSRCQRSDRTPGRAPGP
ncbi:MAG TPA: hypothetical protein VKD72_24475, partial [Gemmataceae bacterium]|nr:hypothetical protein [Gemmataceae bacterium]